MIDYEFHVVSPIVATVNNDISQMTKEPEHELESSSAEKIILLLILYYVIGFLFVVLLKRGMLRS